MIKYNNDNHFINELYCYDNGFKSEDIKIASSKVVLIIRLNT